MIHPLPSYAYVPGKTPRHAEDAFDAIKADLSADIPTQYLRDTDAFQTGISYLENGFYWEAHELLEAIWMLCPTGSPERAFVQGIIQVANACLKRDMDRPAAADKIIKLAQTCFESASNDFTTPFWGYTADDMLNMHYNTKY